jgi:putative transposase
VPRLKPAEIRLSEPERQELEAIVNRHHSPQQLAQRARIILQAGENQDNRAIARTLGVSRDMVQLWRQRWLATAHRDVAVSSRLRDAERPGAPAQFSMEQVLQLFAIACVPPSVYGYPISHWTARELADVLVKEGIVPQISARHVGRLLAEADLKPHQSQYWLHPPKKTTRNLMPKFAMSQTFT